MDEVAAKPPPEGSAARFDATAALIRAESEHLDAKLNALVTRLAAVPGLSTVVSYRHGWLRRLLGDLPYVNDLNRRTGPIEKIVVTVGPGSYALHRDGCSITCERSSGPAQSNAEALPFSIWAEALFDDIAEENLANHDSLVALRRLVEHDLAD